MIYSLFVAFKMVEIISSDGTLKTGIAPDISSEQLLKIYEHMVLVRLVDERMILLQRQGRIGFYIGSRGEEATHVASAAALEPEDFIVPCYRELGAALIRGFPLYRFVCQLFGNRDDLTKGRQMPCHYAFRDGNIYSISSPIATQIPHAVGLSWAAKIRGEKRCAIVYFGEGATSEGDFHVGMNFAGVFKTPTIFLCRNNQYAISVPYKRQTASETIAEKAAAYGFEGVRVDGNDAIAVYKAVREAREKACNGGGPTLIEAYTFRVGAHSTSDDPRAYRSDEEVEEWIKKDPIATLKKLLINMDYWSEEKDKLLTERLNAEILETVSRAESVPQPDYETMFEDLYAGG